MAQRPVFLPAADSGLVDEAMVEFEWFPGFAVVQKQRSIEALHATCAGWSEVLCVEGYDM